MQTVETNERYLEEIFFLQQKENEVRAIDICKAMGYSKPTISIKIKQLLSSGYIIVKENGTIQLTDAGIEIASKISERHHVLTDIFTQIGVDKNTAETDACKIEHDLSDITFNKLKDFFNK